MKVKEFSFNKGVCTKSVPDNVRIIGVFNGEKRVPHRINNGLLEVKEPLTGKYVVHYLPTRPAPVAKMYPMK